MLGSLEQSEINRFNSEVVRIRTALKSALQAEGVTLAAGYFAIIELADFIERSEPECASEVRKLFETVKKRTRDE
jgi:hypothetical protein